MINCNLEPIGVTLEEINSFQIIFQPAALLYHLCCRFLGRDQKNTSLMVLLLLLEEFGFEISSSTVFL